MKASLHERDFQAISNSSLPSPVPEAHGVFRHRVLPSTSERQARTVATAYIVLGVSWIPTSQQLEGKEVPHAWL